MALPMDADSKMRTLDARVGVLGKVDAIDQQHAHRLPRGTSKIIISQNEARIETQGKLRVRSRTGLDHYCYGSMSIKAGSNLTVAASGAASVKANGVLTLQIAPSA